MSTAPNDRLRSQREATPSRQIRGAAMTRTELADLVNAHVYARHGVESPVDRKYIAKLERGAIRWPNARYRAALRDILGVARDRDLGFVSSNVTRAAKPCREPVETVPAFDGLVLPWTPDGAIAALAEIAKEDPMDRRAFVTMGAETLALVALEWVLAMDASAANVERVAGRRLLDVHVDGLDQITAHLRAMDDQFGGGAVLDQAGAQVRHVTSLIRDCAYSDTVGRHLHSSAAELLRLTGWLAYDANHHALAQRYWAVGLRCATAAGDREVGANILVKMSAQARYLGNARDAVRLAEAAAHHDYASPKLNSLVHLYAASAYSAAGDAGRCQRAIDTATESFRSTGPDRHDPEWAYWLDEPAWHEMVGHAHLTLGDFDRADDHLRASMVDNGQRRETAMKAAFLAQVHAGRGEPDQAVSVAGEALDLLLGDVDSDRCAGYVRDVSDALVPYRGLPAVRDFEERVAMLSA